MNTIGAATAAGIIAAVAMIDLWPASADAAVITRTYEIEAAGFAPLFGSLPAPVDPVQISVTVTFDNAANITDQTAGITLNGANLSLGSALGFTYLAASDSLFLGGVQAAVGGTVGNSDDWTALFSAASTSAPEFTLFIYTIASSGEAWSTFEGAVTVPVAEPSALALLPLGLFAIGAFARRPRAR